MPPSFVAIVPKVLVLDLKKCLFLFVFVYCLWMLNFYFLWHVEYLGLWKALRWPCAVGGEITAFNKQTVLQSMCCAALPQWFRAGLHDNVLGRPSAKAVAPVGCQLVTMTLKINTVTIPQKVGCTAEAVTQIWDVSASGLSCTRLANFLPPWQ